MEVWRIIQPIKCHEEWQDCSPASLTSQTSLFAKSNHGKSIASQFAMLANSSLAAVRDADLTFESGHEASADEGTVAFAIQGL
jgi:hypothetical protein